MGGVGMVQSALSAGKTRAGNNAAKKMVTIRRRIPVRYEVDVFVAGGGPSGVAASVAAARQGHCAVYGPTSTGNK